MMRTCTVTRPGLNNSQTPSWRPGCIRGRSSSLRFPQLQTRRGHRAGFVIVLDLSMIPEVTLAGGGAMERDLRLASPPLPRAARQSVFGTLTRLDRAINRH